MNNPIIQRELVGMLCTRKALLMQAVPACLFTLLVALRWPTDARVDLSGAQAQEVFALFGYGLLATLILLVPAFPATTIVREKNRGTLALLLNSPLSPWAIYFGKLTGVLGFVLLPLIMSIPAAAACYAMGGLSLWDQVLDLPADSVADGQIHEHRLKGPLEWPVRVLERSLWLPDHSTPVRIAVGEDQDEIHRALRSFNQTLILSLAALATVLILAALVQVSLGLRPLGWLRAELATIRSGGGRRFVRPMPSEVQPLIDDLNALLDHADEVVERARLEAGNLAHSLKTHLCVLANEAEQLASLSQPNELAEVGQQIRGRVDAMRRNLDHHMARARAAASHGLPGASTDVAECAAALVRVMTKVHAERHLTIRCDVPAGLLFAGDRQDLEQMLGNLLDNACTWARAKVDVGSNRDHPMLVITVDDDGPGLRPEQRQAALSPGVRLDETLPGSGLGLAVVGDLVRLYGGELKLAQSPLGGLRASLRLPAVANQHPA